MQRTAAAARNLRQAAAVDIPMMAKAIGVTVDRWRRVEAGDLIPPAHIHNAIREHFSDHADSFDQAVTADLIERSILEGFGDYRPAPDVRPAAMKAIRALARAVADGTVTAEGWARIGEVVGEDHSDQR